MALKSGDQLLILLFVSSVSLAMISCPGNLFARVISGQCEAGHYRQLCQWSRKTKAGGHEVLSISPLEFLNLYIDPHKYSQNSEKLILTCPS